MRDDIELLRQLNVQIGAAETSGDRAWLDGVLMPHLSFRRANGAVVDREGYLSMVEPSGKRETDIEAIQLYGDRAVVSCIVTMQSPNGERRKFHNLRLFTRIDSGWKLLGWANEPM